MKIRNFKQLKNFTFPIVILVVLVIVVLYYFSVGQNKQLTPDLNITNTINNSVPKTSNTLSPTVTPLKSAKVVSTVGWKTVSLAGVSFKVPDKARLEIASTDGQRQRALLYDSSSSIMLPSHTISVEKYQGGSRREQFLGKYSYDCHYIFEEAMFGNIKALQIAGDVGWCQGGSGGIIAVIGDKFVAFHNLSYDLNSKIIRSNEITNTIISTLQLVK